MYSGAAAREWGRAAVFRHNYAVATGTSSNAAARLVAAAVASCQASVVTAVTLSRGAAVNEYSCKAADEKSPECCGTTAEIKLHRICIPDRHEN